MTSKRTTNKRVGRRRFLKGIGASGIALGGVAAPASAGKGKGGNGGGKEPMEETASRVEFDIYLGMDRGGDDGDPDGSIDDIADFGYPNTPAVGGKLPPGMLFDTTMPELTPNGRTMHHVLRFVEGALIVNKPKPYVMTHEGGGRYVAHGELVNFEVGEEQEIPPPLNRLPLSAGKYRAACTDVLQLYESGGMFDWALTRCEFYRRGKGGIEHMLSLLYVLWDADGPENDHDHDRGGDPGFEGIDGGFERTGEPPTFPPGSAKAINTAARDLIEAGVLNPGGQ